MPAAMAHSALPRWGLDAAATVSALVSTRREEASMPSLKKTFSADSPFLFLFIQIAYVCVCYLVRKKCVCAASLTSDTEAKKKREKIGEKCARKKSLK